MDIEKRITNTDQQIAKVASKIEELECSLKNATIPADEKTENKASIVELQRQLTRLQGQLVEWIKRLHLSK